MNNNSSISVLRLLGATIHTREAMAVMLREIKKNPCNQVDLDFTGVEFISRSFADQFHEEKARLAEITGKEMIVTNANESVIDMLQAVSRTQNKSSRNLSNIPVYQYSDRNSLERFLISF